METYGFVIRKRHAGLGCTPWISALTCLGLRMDAGFCWGMIPSVLRCFSNSEGPSTQYLRLLAPTTMALKGFGARNLVPEASGILLVSGNPPGLTSGPFLAADWSSIRRYAKLPYKDKIAVSVSWGSITKSPTSLGPILGPLI